MLTEFPLNRPSTPLLDQVEYPADLRKLEREQLEQLAEEMRGFLLWSVGQTGGHFGAGLGVVELTIALHYLYDTPNDQVVWDVGHQTYPHKILTGRKDRMQTMRQAGGLSGFPKRSESEYDAFGVGHSSTSISAAMGMALALANAGDRRRVCAVIGDGAMTGGMAIEALAHAGHVRPDMLVVLNDNQMSIGHNSGGLASYFAKMWSSKTYIALREGGKSMLKRIPPAWDLAKRTEEHMKGMVAPGTLFEELGWHYIGPIDGHDLPQLLQTIENMRELEGPQLLHIQTRKGRGFEPAESDQVGYHAIGKIEPEPQKQERMEPEPAPEPAPALKKPKYQDVFGEWLCDMALLDERLIGITPAMCEGSGMVGFAQRFPERFHDVAIAEQHAVTLGAGIACEGGKPVVAIYSTFLQRGYDQLVHDVALQNLDVTFGIDRAGLVGEDGATHAGSFDLTYMRCLPNMVIAAPSDENECRQLLYTCYQFEGPASVRYPRGTGPGAEKVLELAASHELLVTVEDNAVAGGAGSAVNELLAREGVVHAVLNLGLPDTFVDHGKRELQLEWVGLDANGIRETIRQRLPREKLTDLSMGAEASPGR